MTKLTNTTNEKVQPRVKRKYTRRTDVVQRLKRKYTRRALKTELPKQEIAVATVVQPTERVKRPYNRKTIELSNNGLPKVGDPCTIKIWKDKQAATVVGVDLHKNIIRVQEDDVHRKDHNGMSKIQNYEYRPNSHNRILTFKRFRGNMWMEIWVDSSTGKTVRTNARVLELGKKENYYEYGI